MRLDERQVLDLADAIYAGGPCDMARRRSAEALSSAFGGAAVMLTRQAGAAIEDLEQANWPEASVELCTGVFCDPRANEVLRAAPALPVGVAMRPDAENPAAFRSTDIFRLAMEPFGLVHPLGAVIARSARDLSFVSLMGRAGRASFTAADEKLLDRLMPALASADRVRRLLVSVMEERQLLAEVLDRVGRPVVVVDDELKLRYVNRPAADLLEEGQLLGHRSSRLCAPLGAGDRLQVAVRRAVSGEPCSSLVPLGAPGKAAVARVEPLRPSEAGVERPLALVVAGTAPDLSPGRIATLYSLTRREAEVASALAAGKGVVEIARQSKRSVNTIKSEARAVYEKLGAAGHTEALLRIRNDLGA